MCLRALDCTMPCWVLLEGREACCWLVSVTLGVFPASTLLGPLLGPEGETPMGLSGVSYIWSCAAQTLSVGYWVSAEPRLIPKGCWGTPSSCQSIANNPISLVIPKLECVNLNAIVVVLLCGLLKHVYMYTHTHTERATNTCHK